MGSRKVRPRFKWKTGGHVRLHSVRVQKWQVAENLRKGKSVKTSEITIGYTEILRSNCAWCYRKAQARTTFCNVQWCVPVQWLHVKAWPGGCAELGRGGKLAWDSHEPIARERHGKTRTSWTEYGSNLCSKENSESTPRIPLPIATSAQACQAHCALVSASVYPK